MDQEAGACSLGTRDRRQPGQNSESCGLFHMPDWIFPSSELGAAVKMSLEPPAWKTGVLG